MIPIEILEIAKERKMKKRNKMIDSELAKGRTYVCIICRHKFTLNIQWMIDDIIIRKYRKICILCDNKMMKRAVYGTEETEENLGCLNCRCSL